MFDKCEGNPGLDGTIRMPYAYIVVGLGPTWENAEYIRVRF